MNAIQFPLTRVAIGLTLGIFYARYCPLLPLHSLILLGALLLLFILLYLSVKKRPKLQSWLGLSVFLFSIGCGISTYSLHRENAYAHHFLHQLNSKNSSYQVDLVLREKIKSSPKNLRYVAEVQQINGQPCFGKVLVHCNKTDFQNKSLTIGTYLSIVSQIRTAQPPMNPGGFDYWRYLQQKNIYGQVYTRSQNTTVQKVVKRDLLFYAHQIRNRALNTLQKNGLNQSVATVLAALIVGQQQEISAEIIDDYQSAGAVHILSVSGLHVGFIVLFLNFALKFLPKNRKTRWLKLGIILFSLWGFALLAGLSASVVRSVTMYSFVAVAMYLKRRTNIFHTLLVSLMLILLVAPSLLFDVGLQLSYVALFFILWLQPILDNFWQPKYKISRYIWQIITVSLAAQLGTLPLSLYYFHQFPGLFLLTNLLVLPLIGLIMAVGVPLMVVAAFGWTADFGIWLITWLIQTLNGMVRFVANADQLVFRNIPFNFWMLLIAYLLICCCVLTLKKPEFSKIKWAMISVFVFQLSIGLSIYQAQNKREWLVLHQKKATAIIDRYGSEIWVYCNENAPKSIVENYATHEFISEVHYLELGKLAQFQKHKIAIVDASGLYPKNAAADIILLCSRPSINLDRLLQKTRPKLIIADGSNYPSSIARWEASCAKQKIPFHYTSKKGFFKLSD